MKEDLFRITENSFNSAEIISKHYDRIKFDDTIRNILFWFVHHCQIIQT